MVGVCGTHGGVGGHKCIQGFGGETGKRPLGTPAA